MTASTASASDRAGSAGVLHSSTSTNRGVGSLSSGCSEEAGAVSGAAALLGSGAARDGDERA